jgi:aspartate aminotransferase-like enzyme
LDVTETSLGEPWNEEGDLLLIPGPTPGPGDVRRALARPLIPHRSPEGAALYGRIVDGLREVLDCAGHVIVLPSSGTGAMESAVANAFSPGQRVLALVGGSFAERFAAIARAFGLDVDVLARQPGDVPDPDEVRARLRTQAYAGVLCTHSETSTGALADVAAIGQAIRDASPETLFLVDSISGAPGAPMHADAWGCDVVLMASQKALMCPPGLAVVSVSQRALEAARRSRSPRFYWDWPAYADRAAHGDFPYTPAVSLFFALDAALARIRAEGLPAFQARHRRMAARVRQGLRALGFEPLAADAHASPTVTTALVPQPLKPGAVIDALAARGIRIAGGMGPLHGRAIRVGHMGAVTEADVERFLGALADVVRDGAALRAAGDA